MSLGSLEFLIKNLSDNGFNSYLRITYDKRPVVSGNVRAWRELFKWATKLGYRIPGYMKSFVYAYPLFFPEYKDSLFSTEVDEDYVFTPLSVVGLHGDIELLAHVDITARLTNDRGVSHEEVRHRPASFAQESTRYCNYSKDKFDNTISYIDLLGGMELDSKVKGMSVNEKSAIYDEWVSACEDAERHYFKMLELGATPQIARSVLNNSTKTEICITMNLAEWRHFFTLRLSSAAHPQMREVASMLLDRFDTEFPQYHKYVGVSE
jgi:thymidylate synthase (FAD)